MPVHNRLNGTGQHWAGGLGGCFAVMSPSRCCKAMNSRSRRRRKTWKLAGSVRAAHMFTGHEPSGAGQMDKESSEV